MSDGFRIEGLEAVQARMREVTQAVAKKATRAAATRAMRIVRDAARRGAAAVDDPETASNIPKKIQTRFDGKASKRENAVVVKVGVEGGARPRKGDEDSGHWRLVEFGTSKMPAQPFMRPALAENVQAVTSAFVAEMVPQIDKAAAKAAR